MPVPAVNDFEQRLARVLMREIDGCRGLEAAERLSGGANQETYRLRITTDVGASLLAFRRAAGGSGKEGSTPTVGLAGEARLMRAAGAAGVPVPTVRYVLEAGDELGDGFLMDWLDGETLGARIARDDAYAAVRPELAYQCGRILAAIHSIDVETAGLGDLLERLDTETYVRRQWEQYRHFATPQPMIDFTARWLLDNRPPERPHALVHNDFRNGNLMVDARDGVVAVLDWEVACIGNPVRDLGWICTNSWRFGVDPLPVGGFGMTEDLLRGYSDGGGTPVSAAELHYWQVFGSFWWAIGCLYMAEHYRSGPDRTVERPGIGRRSSECQVDCVNLLIPGAVSKPAPAANGDDDMPTTAELLGSVRDFLRDDLRPALHGRDAFLARVAANSLDIVARDAALGPASRAAERDRLTALLGRDGALRDLRAALVMRLRDEATPLDDPRLAAHLRQTVVDRVAIDQPRYAGYRTALANAGLEP